MSYGCKVFSQTKHVKIVDIVIVIIIIPLICIQHLLSEMSGISTIAKILFKKNFTLKVSMALEMGQTGSLSSKR